jgi:hypothetical protein
MQSGSGMPFVDCNGHFELTMGAFEIVDPNEGGPEHDMVFGRFPCGIDCLTNQVARFVERTELTTNHGQTAKGAHISGLIGENPSIGLFGGMQGVLAGNGDC